MKTVEQLPLKKVVNDQYISQIRYFDQTIEQPNFNYVEVYVVTSNKSIYLGSYYISEDFKNQKENETTLHYNKYFVAIVSVINGREHCIKLYNTKSKKVYDLSSHEPFNYKKYLRVRKDTFTSLVGNELYEKQQEEYQKMDKQKLKVWALSYK